MLVVIILPLIFHHSGVFIPSSCLFPKAQCGQVQGCGLQPAGPGPSLRPRRHAWQTEEHQLAGGGWGDHLLAPIVHQSIVGSTPSALRTAGDNGGMRSTGSCFPAWALAPAMTPGERPPGRRPGLYQAGGGAARIPHHLPGNRSCRIVGWRVFFSILGGGFLPVSAWRVRRSWETICFLPPEGPSTWPGVYGLLRPPGSPAQGHAKSDPTHA